MTLFYPIEVFLSSDRFPATQEDRDDQSAGIIAQRISSHKVCTGDQN